MAEPSSSRGMEMNEPMNGEEDNKKQGNLLNFGLAVVAGVFFATTITFGYLFFFTGNGTPSVVDPAPGPSGPDRLTIILYNDVYELLPVNFNKGTKGGVARAATLINEAKANNPGRTFSVFAGDLLSPSSWSSLFQGKQMVDLMNFMELDVACIGNHEFDFGLQLFDERAAESKFPWLNANFLDATTGKIINRTVESHAIDVKIGDVTSKLCFFGVGYDFRESIGKDTHLMDFKDTLTAAEEQVAKLKEDGCSVIVAVTHQFNADDCTLSRHLGEDVDLILGGHDHTAHIDQDCGGRPFLKADSDLKSLWVVDLYLTPEGKVNHRNFNFMTVDETITPHPETKAAVDVWGVEAEKEFGRPLGCSVEPLDATNAVRTREMPIGNMFTDAIRLKADTDEDKRLEIMVTNGGGLRGNKVFPTDLTVGDVVAMHPFGNTVIQLLAKGSAIREVLELGVSEYESVSGGFNQVSGIKVIFDISKSVGERLTSVTLNDGTPLDDDQDYKLGVPNYMYDTIPVLRDQPFFDMIRPNDARPIIDFVIDAIRAAGENCIDPSVDENSPRITIIGASATVQAHHEEVRQAKVEEQAAKDAAAKGEISALV